jgi:predicted Zn-dependent protease
MKITGKTIKEDLARSKSSYLKNEDLKMLATLAAALKAFVTMKLPGTEKTEVEGHFREAFANMSKSPRVLKFLPKGIPYVKGQEPKLFQYVAAVYKKVQEDIERETLEQMRQRKLRIDQCIIKGQKLLEDGNLVEAQRNFREAVTLHVDENGLFPMLAMKLMDKGHHKASLEYIRGAIEVSPDNSRAYDLLVTAVGKLGEVESGLKVLSDARKKIGENPMLLAASAQIKVRAGKWEEVKADAEKALAAQPDLAMAQKALARANKQLGA